MTKQTRERNYTPLEPFQFSQPTVFGLSVVRFMDEETHTYVYRPTLELEVETSESHMLLIALDIYDHDLYDACFDAVVAGSRFCPGFFDEITMFDEGGNIVEDGVPFTISEIMEDIDAPMIDPEELSKDRVLH
jgi:hypothetical protein